MGMNFLGIAVLGFGIPGQLGIANRRTGPVGGSAGAAPHAHAAQAQFLLGAVERAVAVALLPAHRLNFLKPGKALGAQQGLQVGVKLLHDGGAPAPAAAGGVRGAVFWEAVTGVAERGAVRPASVTWMGAVRPAAATVICWLFLQ